MLSFGWVFGAALLLTLHQSSALPSVGIHEDKPAHLQGRYRIVGQPPPPCVHKICPLVQRGQPEDPSDASVHSVATSSETHDHEEPKSESDKPHFSKTAPLTCHDGTHPPCGQAAPVTKHPTTHQTAPVTCGDGKKPPCGEAGRKVPHFPGTHQTAPISCGDGSKPPCGQAKPVPSKPHDCGDGATAPCVLTDPGKEPPHPDLLPHHTAPITCGEGSNPPCGQNQTHHFNPSFPGTHQSAPISCGDGTKPPCRSSNGSYLGPREEKNKTTFTFPRPHQTAPVSCGDGRKPPCH